MAEFLLPLRGDIDLKGITLTEPFAYQSDLLGRIDIPIGFFSDFETVMLDTPLVRYIAKYRMPKSSVVHDWLIESKHCPRSMADKVLLEATKAEDLANWRRYLIYAGVSTYTGWIKVKGWFTS